MRTVAVGTEFRIVLPKTKRIPVVAFMGIVGHVDGPQSFSPSPAPCLVKGPAVVDRNHRTVEMQVLRCERCWHIAVAADLYEQLTKFAVLAHHHRERLEIERFFQLAQTANNAVNALAVRVEVLR